MALKLGTAVEYIGSDGNPRLAFIIGTHESIKSEGPIPQPLPDHAHLEIHTFSAGIQVRPSVPLASVVEGNENYQNDDGVQVGVFRLID